MNKRVRTTKYVTGTFKVIYHGDYIDVDEIAGVLDGILGSACEDRDDLQSYDFTVNDIEVRPGDPEGYDV